MRFPLLPLSEQTMVITGASSGIGLVTAKQAAARGARVVLAARNAADLEYAVEEIRSQGGRAIAVTADVADLQQVEQIGVAALREFGRIHTWVNNAAVSMYGRVMEVSIDDMRRQMDVNYWGQVYGSRVAVRLMRERGGALINVASALSDRAIPLQVNYCAAKHAIKAFTDGLRMELEEEGAPIAVTLLKPASIDTPFFDKAKTVSGGRAATGAPGLCAGSRRRDNPACGAASAPPAARGWGRGQAECSAVRASARGSLHGAVDVRLPTHPQAGERTARQPVS